MKSMGLFAGAFLTVAASSAQATPIIYTVNEGGLQSQQCFPACSSFGSLAGTITTDGTLGTELSPSIIVGWNLSVSVGAQQTILTDANSSLAFNDPSLLTASSSALFFDFSARHLENGTSNQYSMNFNSLSLGSISLFTATYNASSFGPQFAPGGLGITAFAANNFANVKYYPEGTGLIEIGVVAAPVPLRPSLAGQFAGLGLLCVLACFLRRTRGAVVMHRRDREIASG